MKTREAPHLRLRVERALLTRLEKAADKNGRTLTGEIVRRLERSLLDEDILTEIRTSISDMLDKGVAA